ncbi:MAG TPA: amidohydrolase family protein [Steroidobacteraceae bacterium]|nr:amidohydrolase family protein [Steroidobacteraceae bacterium]
MNRRHLLASLAATAAAWSLPASGASSGARSPGRIVDVHAHYYPPVLKALGLPGPMNAWSLQRHMEEMDAAGVTRSLFSLTTPGIVAKGDEGRKLTRESNEYAAKTCAEQRGKLGFFTYVQLEDLDVALQELEYGLDVLKAQGVGLFTSYGNRWLGDPYFDPVFAELERRKAIVYVHPTGPACCSRLLPGLFDTLIEYGTDTTRAIASYIYRGAARRFPNVRMIWSHSGGTMPFLIERFDGEDRSEAAKRAAPEGFRAAAGRFFYDIAQASNSVATTALRSVVPVNHIVFGTDYPFRTPLEHVTALQESGVFSRSELNGVYRGNVEQFLPALLS